MSFWLCFVVDCHSTRSEKLPFFQKRILKIRGTRLGAYARDKLNEQTPLPHFCLKVVCKNGGRIFENLRYPYFLVRARCALKPGCLYSLDWTTGLRSVRCQGLNHTHPRMRRMDTCTLTNNFMKWGAIEQEARSFRILLSRSIKFLLIV